MPLSKPTLVAIGVLPVAAGIGAYGRFRTAGELASLKRSVETVPLGACRSLRREIYSDTGGYSGVVRLNDLSVIVGSPENVRAYVRKVESSVGGGLTFTASNPALFTEKNSSGGEFEESCSVIHVTRVRAIEWLDFERWGD